MGKVSIYVSNQVNIFTQFQGRFLIAMCTMNEKYNLEYLEMNVTGKTVLFHRVEPKTLHKLKPKNPYQRATTAV
jgi:hypothetical protein